jgi:LysM repeat protein
MMKQWKRLAYYLIINVLVSACTTVAVLYLWDRAHTPAAGGLTPVAFPAAGSGDQPVSADPLASGTLPASGEVISPTLTSMPTEDPYASAIQYQVKADDTLGVIAEDFDVPLEELLAYNQLDDANSLSVGQIIYIPVTPEAPTETPTPRAISTGSTQAANLTSTPSGPAKIEINGVFGPGDLTSERVYIVCTSGGPVSLAGWTLEDEDGNVFDFPQVDLYSGGAVNIWTTVGSDIVLELYWDRQTPVWESGEQASLKDAQGKIRAEYEVP